MYKFLLLYGKFDAGICFWDYRLQEYHPENYEIRLPDQHCCFAWQFAFGIEAGIGHWGLFVQAGLGMNIIIICIGQGMVMSPKEYDLFTGCCSVVECIDHRRGIGC